MFAGVFPAFGHFFRIRGFLHHLLFYRDQTSLNQHRFCISFSASFSSHLLLKLYFGQSQNSDSDENQ